MNRKKRQFKSTYSGPRSRRKTGGSRKIIVAAGAVLILGVSLWAAVSFKGIPGQQKETAGKTIAEETKSMAAITVNGVSLTGMSREQAKQEISSWYPWEIKVAYGEDITPLDNLLEPLIDEFLDTIYMKGDGDYTFTFDGLEDIAVQGAAEYAKVWDVKPKNSALERFDKETGTYVFSEGCYGTSVNQNKLADAIIDAVKNQQFDTVIQAETAKTAPELTMEEAKARYKTLASFTTETTDNAKRNTNVRLAAEALDGTIVQPGEEFSFNAVVGQRTAEKGYQEAAAYSSGEVVQEVGGGVCQISSTLYRVVFQSGMTITYRRSHTFEPNYVTPGQDAAISWELPDFRFINESDGPVCIRASYSNRKASVSIFGIPVLEDGITWDLYSEKVEEIDEPEPVYVEDATLEPGTEKVSKAGSKGSRWVTYKIVSKDGKEIEREEDHSKTYLGHAAVIRRNTSSVSEISETTVESESTETLESTVPVIDGMPEGYRPDQEISSEEVPSEETLPEETAPSPMGPGDILPFSERY